MGGTRRAGEQLRWASELLWRAGELARRGRVLVLLNYIRVVLWRAGIVLRRADKALWRTGKLHPRRRVPDARASFSEPERRSRHPGVGPLLLGRMHELVVQMRIRDRWRASVERGRETRRTGEVHSRRAPELGTRSLRVERHWCRHWQLHAWDPHRP